MVTATCCNCNEKFEVDPNDDRPWAYHECINKKTGKMQVHLCDNPNRRPKIYQFIPKRAPQLKPRDHILREYYGLSKPQKQEEDEDDEENELNEWGF